VTHYNLLTISPLLEKIESIAISTLSSTL